MAHSELLKIGTSLAQDEEFLPKHMSALSLVYILQYSTLTFLETYTGWPGPHPDPLSSKPYQTCFCYQMWFAKNCSKNSRKSQKSPIFDQKCSCLVMLSSGSTEIWFQPELPDLYILHQEMVIFGIFSNFLSNIHQPHLLARQDVTFWRVGQCMSASDLFWPEICGDWSK